MNLRLTISEIRFILECMDMWESDHISHMYLTEVKQEDIDYLEKLRNKIYRVMNSQDKRKD